jgi:hypothetical protein
MNKQLKIGRKATITKGDLLGYKGVLKSKGICAKTGEEGFHLILPPDRYLNRYHLVFVTSDMLERKPGPSRNDA